MMMGRAAKNSEFAVAARAKFVLQLRRMPRCDKNFCFACARLGIEGCRSNFGGAIRFFARRRAGTLMPVHESEAIILQSYPLGEADRLVSFLSRSMGRVRGVASGARRTKSRFGSTLERLSHVHIWFYEKQNRELVRINQCDLVESFLDAFRDYGSGVALAILSEVTETVLPDHEPSDANFRLLLLVAQSIKKTGKPELPLAYFVLWTVKLGGWLPTLDACARCGRKLDPQEAAYFSPSASAISCSKCRRAGMRTLSPAVLAAARKMVGERLDKLNEEMIRPRAARDLSDVMLDVIEHQIDRKLTSRELLERPA
jgi:DNA repair protein RecO (recombination protein O)